MPNAFEVLIQNLKALTELDASIARYRSQQKQQEEEKATRLANFNKIRTDYENLKLEVDKHRARNREEENRLKDENDKLVERRKALATFSNYKVQQSAQKEIEQSAKQISSQEEKLIVSMEELEEQEKKLNELEELFNKTDEEYKTFTKEVEDEIDALIERAREKEGERESIVSQIDPKQLSIYDGIRARHPMDPLVPIQNGNCGGCYMGLGPQIIVQVSRASSLVKCRGCSRILYIDKDNAEENPANT